MTKSMLRVGLIGANPDKGWGSAVHVPVLGHLDGFALTAVATSREDSARRSAAQFGARHHFTDPAELAACPEVDLVTIAVKAPDHHRMAMIALEAGKHVYCEWPLAANLVEAEEMASLARRKGVQALVGLQSRGAPPLLEARRRLTEGYVGTPIAVRMTCALPGGGARRSAEGLYVIDRKNGASTLAIQGGHAIDALRFCAGEIRDISAMIDNHFRQVEVIETGERRPKDAPDQILGAGHLDDGVPWSVAIHGGVVAGHHISLTIFGEEGTIALGWEGPLNFQMSELWLRGGRKGQKVLEPLQSGDWDPKVIPDGFKGASPYPGVEVPRATLVNVANLYLRLGTAIHGGAADYPSFETGLGLHRILDAFQAASDTGLRQFTTSAIPDATEHEVASL